MSIKQTLLFAATLLFACAAGVQAQQNRQAGGSLFGGGQSAFGQSGFGQSSFGQPGFGQSAFGQNTFGQAGGQSAFGGGQNQGGFVGRDGNDAAGFFEQLGRGQGQFLQQVQRSFGRGANRGRGAQPTQEKRPPVQVSLSLGFTPPRAKAGTANNTLDRITTSFALKGYSNVAIKIENRVAILTGVVPTPADRRLAERIASLEPGVSSVENRLVAASEAEPLPPATES